MTDVTEPDHDRCEMNDLGKKIRRIVYTAAPLIAFALALGAGKRW